MRGWIYKVTANQGQIKYVIFQPQRAVANSSCGMVQVPIRDIDRLSLDKGYVR